MEGLMLNACMHVRYSVVWSAGLDIMQEIEKMAKASEVELIFSTGLSQVKIERRIGRMSINTTTLKDKRYECGPFFKWHREMNCNE